MAEHLGAIKPKLISLEAWLNQTYGDGAPSLRNARAWARNNRIFPPAKKQGRSYFVQEDARYVAPDELTRRAPLLERINGRKTA